MHEIIQLWEFWIDVISPTYRSEGSVRQANGFNVNYKKLNAFNLTHKQTLITCFITKELQSIFVEKKTIQIPPAHVPFFNEHIKNRNSIDWNHLHGQFNSGTLCNSMLLRYKKLSSLWDCFALITTLIFTQFNAFPMSIPPYKWCLEIVAILFQFTYSEKSYELDIYFALDNTIIIYECILQGADLLSIFCFFEIELVILMLW